MIVVLSGEGPTDLGQCRASIGNCTSPEFVPGPLAILLDHLVEPILGYRPTTIDQTCVYVPKAELSRRKNAQKGGRSVSFVGKKRDQETAYFYVNTWMLGEIAVELEQASNDKGFAVFHRDSDDAVSTGAATWASKFKSMCDGFKRAQYDRGVPMLPRPISEAWLLCLSQSNGTSCASLEDERSNPTAPNPLKEQLATALGGRMNAQELCDWIDGAAINFQRLGSMPSFANFWSELDRAVREAIRSTTAVP